MATKKSTKLPANHRHHCPAHKDVWLCHDQRCDRVSTKICQPCWEKNPNDRQPLIDTSTPASLAGAARPKTETNGHAPEPTTPETPEVRVDPAPIPTMPEPIPEPLPVEPPPSRRQARKAAALAKAQSILNTLAESDEPRQLTKGEAQARAKLVTRLARKIDPATKTRVAARAAKAAAAALERLQPAQSLQTLSISVQGSRKTLGMFVGYLKVSAPQQPPYYRLICAERPTEAEVQAVAAPILAHYQATGTVPARHIPGAPSLIARPE